MSAIIFSLALDLRDISWIERLRKSLTSPESRFITASTKQDRQEKTEPFVTSIVSNEHCSPAFREPAPRTIDEARDPMVEQDLQGPRVTTRMFTARQANPNERPTKLENAQVKLTALPETKILLGVLRAVLQDFRLRPLLKEVSRYTPQEKLHVELKEVIESYINRLSRTAAFLELDILSDPSGCWEQSLVTELTSEASRLLSSIDRQTEIGSSIHVDKDEGRDRDRSSFQSYLLNPRSQR